MCSQVFLGLYMTNIHSLLVLVHHRHRFLSPILSTRRLNVPEPTNRGGDLVWRGFMPLFSHFLGPTITQPSKVLHIATHSGLR